jgi:glutathione S-transferase
LCCVLYSIIAGNVPGLVTPSGLLLNEGAAVLQYIADKGTDKSLTFEAGSDERYHLQNTLNYLASDLHAAGYGPLFGHADKRDLFYPGLHRKLKYVNDTLLKNATADAPFLFGKNFTIADSYLYIILSWSGYVGVDLAAYDKVKAFSAAVAALPKVKEAHEIMNKQASA